MKLQYRNTKIYSLLYPGHRARKLPSIETAEVTHQQIRGNRRVHDLANNDLRYAMTTLPST